MKTKLLVLLSLFLWQTAKLQSASPDALVQEGRTFLAAHNLTNANARFAAAVTSQPNHETANAFYAVTRLLVLPEQSPLKEFMDRMGFASTNRNIYGWDAQFARDTNGVPQFPGLTNFNETTEFLRSHVLTELSAAEVNLANVVSTNFLLKLSADETARDEVILDYGDILMLRSLFKSLEYFGYTLHAWNLDAQMTAVRSLFSNDGKFSMERLLLEYSQLFTFANTADLAAAKPAFTNAIALYLRASQFIRNRSPGAERLFNFDASLTSEESGFRRTLSDLKDSVDRVVTLQAHTNVTVNFARQFDGSFPFRSALPQFADNAVVLGSLPDATFGGTVTGLRRGDVEQFLSNPFDGHLHLKLEMRPSFGVASALPDGSRNLELNTLAGRSYIFQESLSLTNWSTIAVSLALDESLAYSASRHPGEPTVFYRAAESPRPANDNFANRITLAGSESSVHGSSKNASSEAGEPSTLFQGATVWWTWTAPTNGGVLISVESKSFLEVAVYVGTSLPVLSEAFTPFYLQDRVTFKANAGVTYQIAISGFRGDDFKLNLKQYPPPSNDNFDARLTISGAPVAATGYNIGATGEPGEPVHGQGAAGQSVWWSWTAPASQRYAITTSGSDFDTVFAVYTGTGFLTPIAQSAFISAVIAAVAGTTYFIAVDTANGGPAGNIQLHVLPAPQPVNDNFANRLVLAGTSVTVSANNLGATKEPGEPDHAFSSGGNSVWWTWTAPASGAAQISTAGSAFRALVGVYQGTTVSTLQSVAYGFGGSSAATFEVDAGQTYEIAVDSSQGEYGDIRFNLEFVPPPANDNFAGRILLSGASVTASGSNLAATREPNEPDHVPGFGPTGHSVWWTWTSPATGSYAISTAGGDYNVAVAIYTGNSVSALTPVITVPPFVSQQTFVADAGAIYQIAADSFSGFANKIKISIRPTP